MEKIYILEKLNFFSKQHDLNSVIAKTLLKLAQKNEKLYLKNVAFHAQCSISAVAKFVQRKLKLNSFYELKYILQQSQNKQLLIDKKDLYFKMMITTFEDLYQTYNYLKVNQIIEKINQFNNLWIVAKGDTFTIAFDLAFKLKRLNLPAHTIEVAGELEIKKHLIRQGDGIILISNSGNTKELIELFKFAQTKKIICLAFLGKANSYLAKLTKQNGYLIHHHESKIKEVEILLTAKLYFIYVFDLICNQIIRQRFQ